LRENLAGRVSDRRPGDNGETAVPGFLIAASVRRRHSRGSAALSQGTEHVLGRISVFGLIACLLCGAQAFAQALPEATAPAQERLEPATPEEARAMVATLSDAEVRALLLERLDAVAAARIEGGRDDGIAEFFRRATEGVALSIVEAIEKAPLLWRAQSASIRTFVDK